MPTNVSHPLFRPGHELTARATAGVIGKRFVTITADTDTDDMLRVGPPAAGAKAFGVATRDAGTGELVSVLRKGIVNVSAGGTVTAGQQVEVDATGRVVTLVAGRPVGTAIQSGGTGTDVFVALAV